MKNRFAIGCLIFSACHLFGQNLVDNPSFETINTCTVTDGLLSKYVDHWYTPTYGTPDFYNVCFNSLGNKVPKNMGGYQVAHTGVGYLGVVCGFQAPNWREYISSKLIDSLHVGKKYNVSFYVNLSDSSQMATSRIGMYLSKDSIYTKADTVLGFIPQIENTYGNIITDTVNWTLISGSFIASGGERYITIGDFYADINSDSASIQTLQGFHKMAYYYIDDVSVVDSADIGDGINELNNNLNFDVYPNPATGIVNVGLSQQGKYDLRLINVLGEVVYRQQETIDGKTIIDVSGFSKGIYFIEVLEESTKVIGRKKLIIQ